MGGGGRSRKLRADKNYNRKIIIMLQKITAIEISGTKSQQEAIGVLWKRYKETEIVYSNDTHLNLNL